MPPPQITTEAELNAAIAAFDAQASGTDTLDLSGTITEGTDGPSLPLDLYAIDNTHANLVINGGGATLDGDGLYRGLFIDAGNVTVNDLTIANAVAAGGAGGTGGGGGAGLGGGLFIADGGSVTLNAVNFTGDGAAGGAGGEGAASGHSAGDGGGGGGLGGAGGAGETSGGGGGGGGIGIGATGASPGQTGNAGIVKGAAGGGAGYDWDYEISGSAGGGSGGGGGSIPTTSDGQGGGGGVGGQAGFSQHGGTGGFGGGGGGSFSDGGGGGFGGGGGGANTHGGGGGFGGGGGGGLQNGGAGGFGAGAGGSRGGGGGGGLAAGGDIFVQQGGNLMIEGGSLGVGTLTHGAGGSDPTVGIAGGTGDVFGSGLFLQGTQGISLAPLTGQTLTISGAITDQDGTTIGTGGSAELDIEGPGTVVLDAHNTFKGGMFVSPGATLVLAATGAAGSGTIDLGSNVGVQIAPGIAIANTIDGFAAGNSFDFRGIAPGVHTSASLDLSTRVLTVTDGTESQTLDLNPAQTFHHATWSAVDDGEGGVVVACYCAGTSIATPAGAAPVETLRIGDLVRTHAGYVRPVKWIGRRGYNAATVAANPQLRPVRIRAGALADGLPRRDLLLSPEHALLLNGVLVPARHLINGVSILPTEGHRPEKYLHIELAAHDVILAEGQPAETFVNCDSRKMFENAAEFDALYPDGTAGSWTFCAPRVEEGETLADLRQSVNSRAGLDHGDWRQVGAPGRLTGNLEIVSDAVVAGWAQDAAAPERPVQLEILMNGEVLGIVLANAYRRDLELAGLGSGRHAFSVRLAVRRPAGVIEVRRRADRAALPGSPCAMESSPKVDAILTTVDP